MILSFDQPPDLEGLIPLSVVINLPRDRPLDDLPWDACEHGAGTRNGLSDLKELVETELVQLVTAAVGYHGCRISNESSYRENGILRSGFRTLIADTAASYGIPAEDLRREIEALGSEYLRHTHGHVFLLRSRAYSLATQFGLEHTAGSETLRTALGRLGIRNPTLGGKPALIACTVPANVMDRKTINLLARGIVFQWLATHHELNVGSDPREGGIRVAADIRPEWIQIEYLPGE